MTRLVVLFEDGTALVEGVEAEANVRPPAGRDLPFLTEEARLASSRAAMAEDDREGAELYAARGVVSPAEAQTLLTFVSPPDWDRFGATLWNETTGQVHAVFTSETMLVGGVAVADCVGRPFADDAARLGCATWCLRNGLDDIAERVARTPVGGDGPHCTWPDDDLPEVEEPPVAVPTVDDEPPEPSPPEAPRESGPDAPSNVVDLFGGTFPRRVE
ncbi:hypothetical protein NAP1_13603 [Erythrobacter sp. NAP1]|nr:hypothetical protein NAP1_13603 [Erythrobacter sp. NAP1]